MNNKYIWITCSCHNYYQTILKINKLNINIYDSNYDNNLLNIKIKDQDYKTIKKYLPSLLVKNKFNTGIGKIHELIHKYFFIIISIFISFIILFILSNLTLDIRVIHSKKDIRNLIYNALEDEGITKLSWKKNYDELTKIKNNILKKYQDRIEWIEVESVGMKYIIRVEERIINRPSKTSHYCNVVASKNGVITDIKTVKGDAKVTRGSYVKKGDILIGGSINLNEEIKAQVCASGSVKAEVWYIVDVTMPLEYTKINKTGKNRINFLIDDGINSYYILRPRLKEYKSSKTKLISFTSINLYLTKDEEIIIKKYKYSKDEALEKAILLAISKINVQKKEKEKIITQKVLKKELNDSKINLEIFFSIEEEIGVVD